MIIPFFKIAKEYNVPMLREIRTIPLEDVPPLNPAANLTCCFCQEELVIYPEPTDTEASYRHNTVARHVRKRHRKIFEKRKNRGILDFGVNFSGRPEDAVGAGIVARVSVAGHFPDLRFASQNFFCANRSFCLVAAL